MCSAAGMTVISCSEYEAADDAPVTAKRWNMGDGRLHGSWVGQLDCETGRTEKNGKTAAAAAAK